MILIFSDSNDYSTTKVIEYLLHLKEPVIRLNREDTVEANFHLDFLNMNDFEIEFVVNGVSISLSEVKSIWFRRGGFYFREVNYNKIRKDKNAMKKQINEFLIEEKLTLNHYIYEYLLASKRWKILGNPMVMNTRKLSVLKMASCLGLNIPKTLVTTKRSDVTKFLDKNGTIITKAIQDNFTPFTTKRAYTCWTEVVDERAIEKLPIEFFPSLFQEKIEKLFDVRVFYLDGDFFSISIFSQESAKTEVDFRNYNFQIPNRKSVMRLPHELQLKLKKLLRQLRLNTASIDLIYSKAQEFIFLEINPVGQYDMVGKHMNFQLDKKIALWLAQKNN